MSVSLKIIVCGPKGVGKSTLCNGFCDLGNPIPADYRPTKGVRILETDQELTDEVVKSNQYLKEINAKLCKIQLWDMGGDKYNEKLWPSIKSDAHGAILIVDGKGNKQDNSIDEWINGFCHPGIELDNIVCIIYNKDSSKSEKQRSSNQFPKLTVYETNYDLNNLLPILHQFVDKLVSKFG